MIDLDVLQAAAEAATPGPWTASVIRVGNDADGKARGAGAVRGSEGNGYVFMSANGPEILVADAEFIAAANPVVVLEWVAEHRAALSRIARVEALHERIGASWPHNGGVYVCRADGGIWPCPTVRALTEGEPDAVGETS